MSSQPTSSNSPSSVLAAVQRRLQDLPTQVSPAQLAAEHEQRQKFRRLIDPGIVRPNSNEQALSSLKTLSVIAENLLREPDNPKYQRFKPTNSIIKRDLMDPKGALEYAIEVGCLISVHIDENLIMPSYHPYALPQLGFRPQVENFQPYYVFHPRYMFELKTGAAILKEHVEKEDERIERAVRAKQEEKAAIEAAATRIKLAFIDDRKSKQQHDDREKELRTARLSARNRQSASPLPDSESLTMPGAGQALSAERPPSYESATIARRNSSGDSGDGNEST